MNSDELILKMENWQKKIIVFEKRLWKSLGKLFVMMVEYAIAMYCYIWVYQVYGWNYVIISLAVGFIVFSLRERVTHA